jgi:hypothetical protein
VCVCGAGGAQLAWKLWPPGPWIMIGCPGPTPCGHVTCIICIAGCCIGMACATGADRHRRASVSQAGAREHKRRVGAPRAEPPPIHQRRARLRRARSTKSGVQ